MLDVNRSFTIANAVTLGASGGGTATFFSDPTPSSNLGLNQTTTFTGGITVNAGGVLQLESAQNNTSTGTTLSSLTTIAGNVTVAGGALSLNQSVASSSSAALAATLSNNLTITSGVLQFGTIAPQGYAG